MFKGTMSPSDIGFSEEMKKKDFIFSEQINFFFWQPEWKNK